MEEHAILPQDLLPFVQIRFKMWKLKGWQHQQLQQLHKEKEGAAWY